MWSFSIYKHYFFLFGTSRDFMRRFQSLRYYTESSFMVRILRQHLHVISSCAFLDVDLFFSPSLVLYQPILQYYHIQEKAICLK